MKLSLLQCALCRFNALSAQEHFTWESPPRIDSPMSRCVRSQEVLPRLPCYFSRHNISKVPGGRGTKEFPVIRGQMFSIAVFIKLLKAMSLATSVSDPRGHIFCQRGNPLSVLNAGNSMKPMKPPHHRPSLPFSSPPSLCVCLYV